ncbi:MAG: DNA polymerase III subunit beta [bacterium]|nr:DNA polymerase III subunit beta [bacterium]
MKLSCTQENLAKGLSIVGRIATSRATLPILANILISTDKGRLRLASTDLEIAITTRVSAKIDQDGGLTIPSRTINDFVITNNDLALDLNISKNTLNIKSDHYEANINGIEIGEYPLIPTITEPEICRIPADKFREAIAHTSFAASTDETRPILNGINFHFSKDEIRLVATDSYRLAEAKIKGSKLITEHGDIVVPTRTMIELARIIQPSDGIVKIFLSENQIAFVFGNTEVISRLIEGSFPAYQQIIPSTSQAKVILKSSELTNALKMSSLFAKESANNVKIKVQGNQVQIIAVSPQLGDNTATLVSTTEGGELEIAFNARYILDALSIIGSEEVRLDLNEINPNKDRKPSILKPKTNSDYLYIIMPLDVQNN